MAKKVDTTVTLIDDLDGGKADRTVSFTVEGKSYEIDLSKKNAAAFDKTLAPYVAAARRVTRTGRSTSGGRPRAGTRRNDLSSIRAWAKAQGIEVAERGRVAMNVQDAYDQAH